MGLLGNALLLTAAVGWLLRRFPLSRSARAAVVLVVCVAALLPVGDLPGAAYLRGLFGDLSIITLCLLAASVASYVLGRASISASEMDVITVVALAGATILYPMALGLGYFDPYALGYGSLYFVGVLFVLALAAWYGRRYFLTLCIALAVIAHAHELLDSRNLWDYLIDPLLVLYALFAQGQCMLSAMRRRFAKRAKAGAPILRA